MNDYKIYLNGYEPADIVEGINKSLEDYKPAYYLPDKDLKAFSPEIALVVVSGITAIAPIIKALLDFLKKNEPATIKINGGNGKSIEFPTNLPKEELENYLNVLEGISVSNVVVSKSKK